MWDDYEPGCEKCEMVSVEDHKPDKTMKFNMGNDIISIAGPLWRNTENIKHRGDVDEDRAVS